MFNRTSPTSKAHTRPVVPITTLIVIVARGRAVAPPRTRYRLTVLIVKKSDGEYVQEFQGIQLFQ
jgi:hypothetical protein